MPFPQRRTVTRKAPATSAKKKPTARKRKPTAKKKPATGKPRVRKPVARPPDELPTPLATFYF